MIEFSIEDKIDCNYVANNLLAQSTLVLSEALLAYLDTTNVVGNAAATLREK